MNDEIQGNSSSSLNIHACSTLSFYDLIISISVERELNRIWGQSEETGYIVTKCGDINLTDEDIISLKGMHWLTDQV